MSLACKRIRFGVALSLLCQTATAHAVTYYVATTGIDGPSRPGTREQPFRTLAYGSSRLAAGDTLLIRKGTYAVAMDHGNGFSFRNGTLTARTRYAAYPGEEVIIKPPSGMFAVYFGPHTAYLEISGLIIDGTNTTHYGVRFDQSGGHRTSHVRLMGNEIRFGHFGVGGGSYDGCEIVKNNIHHMRNYGIYSGHSDNRTGGLIDGNVIHDNGGYGIHLYAEQYGADNNIIRNNLVYRNGTGYWKAVGARKWRTASGIIVARGKNNQVYNNVVYDNTEGGINVYSAPRTLIANNTVYNNGSYGISPNGDALLRVTNNLAWGNRGAQIVSLFKSTLENNLTTDPSVMNTSAGDFRLKPQSPAIDTGKTLSEFAFDIGGAKRPAGKAWDRGAYEFAGALRTRRPTQPGDLRIR